MPFCSQCGFKSPQEAKYCLKCGTPLTSETQKKTNSKDEKEEVIKLEATVSTKSRLAAGLLAIFVGAFGIHNFYLGFNKKGTTQLLISIIGGFFTCGIATSVIAIWALVEGILIFSKAEGYTTDAEGKTLAD